MLVAVVALRIELFDADNLMLPFVAKMKIEYQNIYVKPEEDNSRRML